VASSKKVYVDSRVVVAYMISGFMHPGNVPTSRIGPLVKELMERQWPDGSGFVILSEKIGCHKDTIRKIIEQRNPGVPFDFADKMFCSLGVPGIWLGPLLDVYNAVEFRETCAVPGCNRTFPEQLKAGRLKRYCSKRCSRLGMAVNIGARPGTRYKLKGLCLRGHPLTGDNLIIRMRPNGSMMRQCATCRRESDRLYKERKREEARAAG
jgi:hypothetical protein